MRSAILATAAIACLTATGSAQQDVPQRCVVIGELHTESVWRSDPAACATRLAPASTFKIPHALVALETAVVTPDSVEKWDGTKYDYPLWNRDHTVVSAMRPSVVWFFQRIAPRIGAARMHQWLTRLRYGNARTDGDVTQYWLNGVLRISPDEQAAFLKQLYSGKLPIAAARVSLIRDALEVPPGAIENANGVTRLDGDWPAGARWHAKTGRTRFAPSTGSGQSRRVNWLVGDLTVANRTYVFASAVWRDGADIGSVDAAQLAVKTFVERGLFKASAK